MKQLFFGAKDVAAVFYGLAANHDTDFFGIVQQNSIEDPLADNIRSMTDKWCEAYSEKSKIIKDVRRLLINDGSAEALIKEYDLGWASDFEKNPLQAKWCYIHGDLHGKNILINQEQKTATLIDYGDIKEGPASIDPITLEFSLFCHPDGHHFDENWPTHDQAKKWYSLEEYMVGCPVPEIIKFTREWTKSVEAGKRERAASTYAYLLRQLKYEDSRKDLVIAFLEGAKSLFDET